MSSQHGAVPILYPTMEDMMRPFELFIEKHEKKIGKVGLAKIVPPALWSPRPKGTRLYEDDPDLVIERCIKQVATGSRGLYRFLLVEQVERFGEWETFWGLNPKYSWARNSLGKSLRMYPSQGGAPCG